MVNNIFITGATGCVGHYVIEKFINDKNYQLFLLVRDVSRFKYDLNSATNITIIKGDMEFLEEIKEELRELLKKMDYLIHIATNWGGLEKVNIDATMFLLQSLDSDKVKKIVLFSTASILGRDNALLPEAKELGTHYVRSKFNCYLEVVNSPLNDKVIHIFPTAIFGGDKSHPYSHITTGLLNSKKFLFWLRFFYIDFGFHFIHADDISKLVKYLIESNNKSNEFVLGNDYISAKIFIKQVSSYFGLKSYFQIKIPDKLVDIVVKIFKLNVSAWDYFSFKYKFFKYKTVNCHTFQIPTTNFTITDILQNLERG